jgi:hypothetical protein
MENENKQIISTDIVKEPENKIVIQNNTFSVENLLSLAVEKGTSLEGMERLIAMRRELKAEWAKEQFDMAMANSQGQFPIIEKTKGVEDNNKKLLYKYAPLDVIVGQTKSIIGENGLSYSIKTEITDGKVKIFCIVKHKSGHSETTDVEMPLVTKTGIMSAPQVVAATITFAKRYAFCNAFGIMTGDEDKESVLKDAKPADVEPFKNKLQACTTLAELQKVWSNLPPQAKGELFTFKEELKNKYASA